MFLHIGPPESPKQESMPPRNQLGEVFWEVAANFLGLYQYLVGSVYFDKLLFFAASLSVKISFYFYILKAHTWLELFAFLFLSFKRYFWHWKKMLFPSTKFIVFVIFCVIGSVKLETFLIWQKINICKCKCVLLVFALFTTIAPFFNFSNNISSCDTPAYFKGMSSFCSWKSSHCNTAMKCHVFQVSVLSIFFFNLNILMNNTMNSQVYPTLIFTSIGAPFLDVSSSIV